jgi:amidohydrolase
MHASLPDLKARALARIDALSAELTTLALDIHEHPELAFEEYRSSEVLTGFLARHGLDAKQGVGGLPTAFLASHGNGQAPRVAVLAEYDALPGVGHGCGHNLICAAAVGAGLAVTGAVDDLPGSLLVIGTPAEEGGGGKILLARAGLFDGVDAAMMFHPSGRNLVNRASLAMTRVKVEFHGKAAHAASAPDLGVNALEAMIQTFVSVHGLRQHLRRDAVMHGVITDGGKVANIVPAYSSAEFSVRANDFQYRDALIDRLRQCVEAAALTTGCQGVVTAGMGYDNMVPNRAVAAACQANLEALGLEVQRPRAGERMGSTDMGDISHLLPAIHPYLAIATEGVPGHSTDFAAAARGELAVAAMLNAARAMAMTCLDLFFDPDLLNTAKAEFQEALAAGRVRGSLVNGASF